VVAGGNSWGLVDSKCYSCLQHGQEGECEKLQAGQPHHDPWESDGANNPKYLGVASMSLTKVKSCLTNPVAFYEMTGSVDEGRVVDVVCPGCSKAFSIVSYDILMTKCSSTD